MTSFRIKEDWWFWRVHVWAAAWHQHQEPLVQGILAQAHWLQRRARHQVLWPGNGERFNNLFLSAWPMVDYKMVIISELFSPRQLGIRAGLQGSVRDWRRLRVRQCPPVPQEWPVPQGQGNVPADENGGRGIFLQELFAQNEFHW